MTGGIVDFKNATGSVFTIINNGYVGIGTTTPGSKLEVDDGVTQFKFSSGADAITPLIGVSNSSGKFAVLSAGAVGTGILYDSTGFFAIGPDTRANYNSNTLFNSIPTTFYISSGGYVGIGTTTPGAKLDVAGRIWQTGTGKSVFLGEGAGASDDLSDNLNTFVGYYAGNANTTGAENTAIGYSAGYSNATGSYNSFMGKYAGYSNTTGSFNSFIGRDVGFSNTTGGNNSFMGESAGYSNTTGGNNSFMGSSAGYSNATGSYNSFMGKYAGYSNTTGGNNSAMGAYALEVNTTGSNNTAMGTDAGRYQTDGITALIPNNSVYLGYGTRGYNNSDSNSIVIGYNAIGIGANSVVLGNDSITTTTLKGYVGIGTTTPVSKLSVISTAGTYSAPTYASGILLQDYGVNGPQAVGGMEFNEGDNYGAKLYTNSSNDYFGIATRLSSANWTERMTVKAETGNVGIGTTSPAALLDVWASSTAYALNVKQRMTGGIADFKNATGSVFTIINNGNVGINTVSPTRRFTVAENTSASPQIRIINTSSYYAEMFVDSVGDLSIHATGTDVMLLDDNLKVCSSGSFGSVSCPTLSLSSTGNLVVENDVYVDDSGTSHGEYKKICPTGYVWIPGNSEFGTEPGFCAMIYEAKCDDNSDGAGNTTATCKDASYNVWKNSSSTCACTSANSKAVVSSDAGYPITYISQRDAQNYCRNIGEGYHLVTDQEWMTIARDVLFVNNNWTSGTVGTGLLFGGNNGETTFGYAGIDPDYGTEAERVVANASSTRAKLKLSTAEYIWDISGNVWDWTDNNVLLSEQPQVLATTSNWGWDDYTDVIRYNALSYIEPTNRGWNSSQGIGRIYTYSPPSTATSSTQYAFARGGNWTDTTVAGVFTLYLTDVPADTYTTVGFRCAR
jgi:formylglycine-generating enzyme required for sulfatase activity